MTTEELETLSRLYVEFKSVREDIFQRLNRISGMDITGMTPLDKIQDAIRFECVRLGFRIDKKVFVVDEAEREILCQKAVKEWRAEIRAEEDALERGRERNRIEMEKRDEQRERKLYKELHKKYGKRSRR